MRAETDNMTPEIRDLIERLEAPILRETRPGCYVTIDGHSVFRPQGVMTRQCPLRMEAARVIRELSAP